MISKNKTILLKSRFLIAVFLGTFLFSLNSCSSDDDSSSKDFLSSHSGTKWKVSESGTTIYLQVNNSESNPFQSWATFDGSCYFFSESNEDGQVEIIENSKNKLIVKVSDTESDYDILTITIIGDILTIKDEYYENGVLEDTTAIPLSKTSDNLDNLEICSFN